MEPQVLKRAAVVLLLAALALLGVVAVRHLREQPAAPPPAVRLAFPPPPGTSLGFSDSLLDAAISPDGTRIVFVATSGGVTQLWQRGLDDDEVMPLAGTEGARLPAWKPTGNVVAFFAGTSLKQIALADTQVTDLATVAAPAGAAWLADGSLVYADGPRAIQRLREGRVADATMLADGDVAHAFPTHAGEEDFVYVAVRQDGRRLIRLMSGGQPRDLGHTSGHAALVEGQLLHVRDGVLLRYAFDRQTGALSNRGVRLGLDVGVTADGRAQFVASRRMLLHAPASARARRLEWLDTAGAAVGVAGAVAGDSGDYWQVRLSPDDRFAAVTAMAPLLRTLDILVMPVAGSGDVQRLTSSIAADSDPVWSPDGTRVLFRSLQGGQPNLFVRRAHAADAGIDPILVADGDETPTDWNGRDVLLQARGARALDVMRLDTSTGAMGPVLGSGFNETDARWSRGGAWMAYVADESGQPDIYARRADGTRVRVSFGGGVRPRWSGDGQAIFFLRGGQMMRADLLPGGVPRFTPPRAIFDAPGIVDFDVAHGSSRFLAILPVDGGGPSAAVAAVVDWMSAGTP